MIEGTEAVASVYNALQALRARCFELLLEGRNPHLTRLLKDLTDQHARQSSEVAVLLSDLWAAHGIRPPAATGTNRVDAPALTPPASLPQADIFLGLLRAEETLLSAYEAAIEQQPDGSLLLPLLARHRVAIITSLQRIEASRPDP